MDEEKPEKIIVDKKFLQEVVQSNSEIKKFIEETKKALAESQRLVFDLGQKLIEAEGRNTSRGQETITSQVNQDKLGNFWCIVLALFQPKTIQEEMEFQARISKFKASLENAMREGKISQVSAAIFKEL